MQQITLFNKQTDYKIVRGEKSHKLGVINEDMDIILPFEYDYIDSVMSAGGVIMAKKEDKKFLIEIE